jgi:adenosylmethionine-8-amino-7-oxononanoate aminotransferase
VKTLNTLLLDQGLLTRATHIIMLSPPLCITRAEVDRIVEIIDSSLTALEQQYGYC